MKQITFKQFVSLVEFADVIKMDSTKVESHEISSDHLKFHFADSEFNIDDDKEFFFDSTGQVTFKDSNDIEVEVNLYSEVPVCFIPSDSPVYKHYLKHGIACGYINIPSKTKGNVIKKFGDGHVLFHTIYGTLCVHEESLGEI